MPKAKELPPETNVKIEIDLSADPDPKPKVGDIINYVTPGEGNKIVEVRVIKVDDTGRLATVEIIDGEKKKVINLPHRPVSALAGNTWHWPAKAAAMLLLFACMAIAFIARAGLPTYHTVGPATGSSTVPAMVILPADPNSQIRVVNVNYTSDNAAAQFSFSSGTTAFSVSYSNTVSSVTNFLDSTNGLTALGNGSNVLVLQHMGTCYTNLVSNWGTFISGTNTSGFITNQAYVVTASAFSIGGTTYTASAGDNIYLMSPPVSWFAGSTSNALNGDDIFSGNYGRPVMAQLGLATTITRLNSISSHYDSASQP